MGNTVMKLKNVINELKQTTSVPYELGDTFQIALNIKFDKKLNKNEVYGLISDILNEEISIGNMSHDSEKILIEFADIKFIKKIR